MKHNHPNRHTALKRKIRGENDDENHTNLLDKRFQSVEQKTCFSGMHLIAGQAFLQL